MIQASTVRFGSDSWLKNSPDHRYEFFACRNFARQFGNVVVQVTMIEAGGHFAVENFLQFVEVEDHSGLRIGLARNGDFKDVIMAVAVRIVTFAEDAAVLLRGEFRIVIKVRGGEFEFSRQLNHRSVGADYFPEAGYSLPFQAILPRRYFQAEAMTIAV